MSFKPLWFTLDGHTPVPTDDVLAATKDRQPVAVDYAGDVRVSTVFLCLDHRIGPGAPLLFETMIFGGEHDGYTDRYSTWEEAEDGHKRALALVHNGN